MKTNSKFEMMQRIENLIIENLQTFCMMQNVDIFIFVKTNSIFHMGQNIKVLIADVQNEDNSIFYMMQNVDFFIFDLLNENKYHIFHNAQ